MAAPLEGIRVVELCNGITNSQTGQMLADFGAEVVQIEPPGGSALRSHPSYPLWGRGKRSIELDLKTPAGVGEALRLIEAADVLLEAYRPGVAERLGLAYDSLSGRNPGLIHVSITGWGRQGPMADVPGYEQLVMAKLGAMTSYAGMTERPGPSCFSVMYGSWSASQMALHGILTALIDRAETGLGQYVETSLALALAGLDPWNQILALLIERYPDAFTPAAPFDVDGAPATSFPMRLLVALTKDGHWLQFSQVQPRLFKAFMHECDLDWMYEDPEWSTAPEFTDPAKRVRMNEILLEAVRQKTLAEWQDIFDSDPNVFAEVFRRGTELLHHPQVQYDGQAVEIDDPIVGRTLQPGPLIGLSKTPLPVPRAARRLDADREYLATAWSGPKSDRPATGEAGPRKLPLAGVTVLELGSFYAAPYGATLLTDLGARVIKVEPLDGEPMRMLVAFPEAGGAKVLQGKELIAIDMSDPEGRDVVLELARRSHLVLRSYRAGVAERMGLGADDLLEVNPDLMYLDAPGFGIDGPYGHRPAFAPTISAGTGIAMRNAGRPAAPEALQELTLADVRRASVRLTVAANSGGTQPDGIAALAVGTALLLARYAQLNGQGGQQLLTTMLLSGAHALSETMIEYADKPEVPSVDTEALGFSARYRLYEAADGWNFLATPTERDWARLATCLAPYVDLAGDTRFVDELSRTANDEALAVLLAGVFRTRPAGEWERDLTREGLGCVVVAQTTMEQAYMGSFGQESGFLTDAQSSIFDVYPRVGPLVRFSRSATQSLGGAALGEHTEALLTELGLADRIDHLREKKLIP